MVPVRVGLGNIVVLSPLIPESLKEAMNGVEGAGGATVSTEKLNGVTVPAEFGEISLPVRRCAPSLSGRVEWTQTSPNRSWTVKVPIGAPSIEMLYEARVPSP